MFAVRHVTDPKSNVLIQDPPIAQFLIVSNAAPWFSKLIPLGELAVALGLTVGALVGTESVSKAA